MSLSLLSDSDWSPPAQSPALGLGEVHLWRACQSAFDPAQCRSLLNEEEQARADRFRFEEHRDRFLIWRALLRSVLGLYLSVPPREVALAYQEQGKPFLDPQNTDLHFNLSHSHDRMLLACCRKTALGVDLEREDSRLQEEAIVHRYFSAEEQAQWGAAPPEDRRRFFFQFWTRREAVLKAEGVGLGKLETAHLLFPAWQVQNFIPWSGFHAAVAIDPFFQVTAFHHAVPALFDTTLGGD